jgi:hypothetical protein
MVAGPRNHPQRFKAGNRRSGCLGRPEPAGSRRYSEKNVGWDVAGKAAGLKRAVLRCGGPGLKPGRYKGGKHFGPHGKTKRVFIPRGVNHLRLSLFADGEVA